MYEEKLENMTDEDVCEFLSNKKVMYKPTLKLFERDEDREDYPLMRFRFLFDKNGSPVGFGCADALACDEERLMGEWDSLYDRYGYLAEDEHRNLYGVETMWDSEANGFIPAVWQRVELIPTDL